MFSYCFDVLMSKIILKKNKKKYFNAFLKEKHFKPLPHSQTLSTTLSFIKLWTKKKQNKFLKYNYNIKN